MSPASTTGTRPVTNVIRVDGRRSTYLAILKKQNASTLAVIDSVKETAPRPSCDRFPGGELPRLDQSIRPRRRSRVIREGIIAAVLVALMSSRSSAVGGAYLSSASIPLSIVVGILLPQADRANLQLDEICGLSLVIGMLVDDANNEIEEHQSQPRRGQRDARRHLRRRRASGAARARGDPVDLHRLFPVILLTGLSARYLFFCSCSRSCFRCWRRICCRALVPTLSSMLLPAEQPEERGRRRRGGERSTGFLEPRRSRAPKGAGEAAPHLRRAPRTAAMASRKWVLSLAVLFYRRERVFEGHRGRA